MDTNLKSKRNRLRGLTRKTINKQTHVSFLKQCIKDGIVPKGFRTRWSPAYKTSQQEDRLIKNILHETGIDLVKLTIRRYKSDLKVHSMDKSRLWEYIRRYANEDEIRHIEKVVGKTEESAL